jgi:hypothetical protein
MVNMLNKYLPEREQLKQITAAAMGSWRGAHGAKYDIKPAIAAYRDYIDGFSGRSGDERARVWGHIVGDAQKGYPAWLVQEYCRADKHMDRTDEDIATELQMNRKACKYNGQVRGVDWWFTEVHGVQKENKISAGRGQCCTPTRWEAPRARHFRCGWRKQTLIAQKG